VVADGPVTVEDEHLRSGRRAERRGDRLAGVAQDDGREVAGRGSPLQRLGAVGRLRLVVVADDLDGADPTSLVVAGEGLDAVVPRQRIRASAGREDYDGRRALGRVDVDDRAVGGRQGEGPEPVPDPWSMRSWRRHVGHVLSSLGDRLLRPFDPATLAESAAMGQTRSPIPGIRSPDSPPSPRGAGRP
jgi:hypothetical protein